MPELWALVLILGLGGPAAAQPEQTGGPQVVAEAAPAVEIIAGPPRQGQLPQAIGPAVEILEARGSAKPPPEPNRSARRSYESINLATAQRLAKLARVRGSMIFSLSVFSPLAIGGAVTTGLGLAEIGAPVLAVSGGVVIGSAIALHYAVHRRKQLAQALRFGTRNHGYLEQDSLDHLQRLHRRQAVSMALILLGGATIASGASVFFEPGVSIPLAAVGGGVLTGGIVMMVKARRRVGKFVQTHAMLGPRSQLPVVVPQGGGLRFFWSARF